jgi:hypothetical protein
MIRAEVGNILPKKLKETLMKKLMTLMLGLSFLVGATAVFAQDETTKTTKSTKKAKKAKKAKKETDTTKKS